MPGSPPLLMLLWSFMNGRHFLLLSKGARNARAPCFYGRLANRDAVLQAALGPLGVLTALDLQARAFADVPLEGLAVVAHMLDDAHSPVVGQAGSLTELALGAEKTLDLRVVG